MKKYRVQGFSRNSSSAANATVAISKSIKNQPPELICVSPPRTLGEAEGAKKNPKIARNAAAPVISKPQVRRELKSILEDRKSTRLNSSHVSISYAVFCLKKKYRNHI